MSKLLFWIVVILLVLLVMRLAARAAAKRAAKPRRAATPRRSPPPGATQPMVRCAHCGVHLPATEAVHRHNHHWCSEAHAQLGPRQQS